MALVLPCHVKTTVLKVIMLLVTALAASTSADKEQQPTRHLQQTGIAWGEDSAILPTNITWVHNALQPGSCTAALFNFNTPLLGYQVFLYPALNMSNTCDLAAIRISEVFSACDKSLPGDCTRGSDRWRTAEEAINIERGGEPLYSGSLPDCAAAYILIETDCEDVAFMSITMASSGELPELPPVGGVTVTGLHIMNYTVTLLPGDCLPVQLQFPDDAMYYVAQVSNVTAIPSSCEPDDFYFSGLVSVDECKSNGLTKCVEALSTPLPMISNASLCEAVFSIASEFVLEPTTSISLGQDTYSLDFAGYACLDLDVGALFLGSRCSDTATLNLQILTMQLDDCDTTAQTVANTLLSGYALTVAAMMTLLIGSCCSCFCCPICPLFWNRRKLIKARVRMQNLLKSTELRDFVKKHNL